MSCARMAAGGLILASNDSGTVTVLEAHDTLEVLARNELAERIVATPAIVQDTLYVRTEQHL